MACASGHNHTITLADDGAAYSFGRNHKGELGLGNYTHTSLPTPIPNLPKINMVSCGAHFTVCVDYEGFIWSFGENTSGQLGTGNTTNFNVPQKILGIPPVLSVSCGSSHILIITNEDLWSCGNNEYGQLCHGDAEDRSIPQKTSFSNISKISTGYFHSLFQNEKGEIFSCGYNQYGQCGLGHFNHPQLTPSLILDVPSNIVKFICGSIQNLFLDSEGNVFSVGYNVHGQLGLGNNRCQNVLKKIPNIPPIKIISCVDVSCYLIDFEGNLWTLGENNIPGQLGHGDKTIENIPKIVNILKDIQQISYGCGLFFFGYNCFGQLEDGDKHLYGPKVINTLKDVQQISYGCSGYHLIAKNSQNQIFVAGNNEYGQLGTGDTQSVIIPREINSQYSFIWGNEFHTRAKSARK